MVRFGDNARRAGMMAAAALGAAAVLALALLLAIPRIVPAEDLRQAAAHALSGTTGQHVVMLGEPSLSVLPSPRVHLGKVSFPLPSGQSLDADNVVARLNLWHLLAGHVDVTEVTVERPTLVLADGGLIPALAVAPLLAAQDRPELRIIGGTIAWRTEEGLTRELISDLSVGLDRIRQGHGVAVSVAFDWRDERVSSNLFLDDAAAFLSGTPTPARFVVSTAGAKVRFQGQAARESGLDLDGDVTVDADSLRDLAEWTGAALPGRGGFGPFSLSSRLKVADGEVSLEDASLDLDGNRGDGGLLVKMEGGRPMVQGTFATDRLNLTPYGGLRLTTDGGREWDHAALDLAFLRSLDLDLRLSAGKVMADQTALETVAASAVLTDGRLVLALGEAHGWGGLLQASLTLAPAAGPSPTGAQVRLEVDATDLNLARALDEVADMRRIEGSGAIQLDVAGSGRTVHDIARGLSGTAVLSSTDGYLSGLDVAQVLHRIERRPLSASHEARWGRTAFNRLDTRLAIKDGVGTVEEMVLEGKQVRVTAEGEVSIAGRTLDLTGRASLVPPPPAKGSDAAATDARASEQKGTEPVDLPFSVKGAWDNPQIMADPLSLIERSGAAQSLIEAVKSRAGTASPQPALNTATDTPAPPPPHDPQSPSAN